MQNLQEAKSCALLWLWMTFAYFFFVVTYFLLSGITLNLLLLGRETETFTAISFSILFCYFLMWTMMMFRFVARPIKRLHILFVALFAFYVTYGIVVIIAQHFKVSSILEWPHLAIINFINELYRRTVSEPGIPYNLLRPNEANIHVCFALGHIGIVMSAYVLSNIIVKRR